MIEEYGGYLPFELKTGQEYYRYDSCQMQRYNTGRTALYCALLDCKPSKIYIPHYTCDTVYHLIQSINIPVERFFVNSKLEPINLKKNLKKDECVLFVNYFGLLTDTVKKYAEKYQNVIIDNSQAFFSEPIMRTGVYNIYSCRKFIGVPDGAYLIGLHLDHPVLEREDSYNRYTFLLKAHEKGTNSAYPENLENEKFLNNNRKLMSILTQKVLGSADYEFIKSRRQENFQLIHAYFKDINRLTLDLHQQVPYLYPLLIHDEKLKTRLIQNHIYVPTLWKEKICTEYLNTVEYDYSQHLVCLPVDQRYNDKNIQALCSKILKLMQ